jgi:AcrR family transcriptional regulator
MCRGTERRSIARVPKVWADTIEQHKVAVRDAVIEAAEGLIEDGGVAGLTMSHLAEAAGIGRATLYKYFSSIEEVLAAWHQDQVDRHVKQLRDLVAATPPEHLLGSLLRTYARLTTGRSRGSVGMWLHESAYVGHAERVLEVMLADVIAAAAARGDVRSDVAPLELARFCLHALGATHGTSSQASADRLVRVVEDGLRGSG